MKDLEMSWFATIARFQHHPHGCFPLTHFSSARACTRLLSKSLYMLSLKKLSGQIENPSIQMLSRVKAFKIFCVYEKRISGKQPSGSKHHTNPEQYSVGMKKVNLNTKQYTPVLKL